MAKESEMVGVGFAAHFLKMTTGQVRTLINDGRLRATKIGREHIIRRADLAKVQAIRKPAPKLKGIESPQERK